MSPKDLNPGVIVGWVSDSDGEAIEGARAVLTRIVEDPGLPRVRTYRVDGKLDDTVWAETEEDGAFVLAFGWEPTQIGNLLDTNPPFHLSVIGSSGKYVTQRIWNKKLYMAVSLRSIADNGIPDFRKPDSIAKSVGEEVIKQAWKIKRIPKLRIMKPSTEMVTLLGFVNVSLDSA